MLIFQQYATNTLAGQSILDVKWWQAQEWIKGIILEHCRITNSQNGWGGKGSLEVISSNSLLKKGYLEQADQD